MDSPVKNKARLARNRLVLILGLLSILLGQLDRDGRQGLPAVAAYVRPNRPSMFTIRRGSRLIVDLNDLTNATTVRQNDLPAASLMPEIFPSHERRLANALTIGTRHQKK